MPMLETLMSEVTPFKRKQTNMQIYDTMKHKKVEFVPREPNKVAMYVCGPTVYNKIHIGNARTFISFDMIRKYMEYRGFEVTFVQNLTDVDDKIIATANESSVEASDIANKYSKIFIDDMHKSNVKDPTFRPKATEEIPEMIELIEALINNGNAYVQEGDVYFSVKSDKEYGKLSGRDVEEAESGHRELRAEGLGLEDRKRDEADFALWKAAKPGEPAWDSPWGKGRPGWHTECAAMSKKYLGLPFDIHGGGADLVFPHHENEIAQAECAWHSGFANYWMHSGMLRVNNEKMSKSLGNFLMLDDILNNTDINVLRLLMMQTHYRSSLDFSDTRLKEAEASYNRIKNALDNVEWLCKNADNTGHTFDITEIEGSFKQTEDSFIQNMDDDFNAPAALGDIFSFIGQLNSQLNNAELDKISADKLLAIANKIKELLAIFEIHFDNSFDNAIQVPKSLLELAKDLAPANDVNENNAFDILLDVRQNARANKDWSTADKIRDSFGEAGLMIEDTPQGAKITAK